MTKWTDQTRFSVYDKNNMFVGFYDSDDLKLISSTF